MNRSNQKNSKAGRDVVGRDINTINYNSTPKSKIEKLLTKLQEEYDSNDQIKSTISELARYHSQRASDGIFGLENKLIAAGKRDHLPDVLEQKEMFVKLLSNWDMYSSAQSIFSYILAKTENEFKQNIYLHIPKKTEAEINVLVMDRIVNPIVNEFGDDLIEINHNVVQGMVYWLAEQCFIRWHHPKQATQ